MSSQVCQKFNIEFVSFELDASCRFTPLVLDLFHFTKCFPPLLSNLESTTLYDLLLCQYQSLNNAIKRQSGIGWQLLKDPHHQGVMLVIINAKAIECE